MTNELIEAMAREIREAICKDEPGINNWEDSNEAARDLMRSLARAALAAAASAGYQLVSRGRLATIWSGGYETGHSDGIGCGHPLARMGRPRGEEAAAAYSQGGLML